MKHSAEGDSTGPLTALQAQMNNSADAPKKEANFRACALLIARLPLMTSETREPFLSPNQAYSPFRVSFPRPSRGAKLKTP